MKNLTTQSLHDVVEAAEEIQQILDGVSLEGYLRDRRLQLAVERLLEIAGEALNRVGKSESEILEDIPDARSVIGMRNRISHGYDVVDNEIVWSSAKYDIPLLSDQVISLLKMES